MDQTTPLTRRAGLRGLGLLASGATLAAVGALAPAAQAAPARTEALKVGWRCHVRVNTTTAWLQPGIARTVDRPATGMPPSPQTWEQSMTLDQHRWLIGRLDTQGALNARLTLREVSGSWARVSFVDQPAPNSYGAMTSWVPTAHLVRDLQQIAMESNGSKIARVTADRTVVYRDAAMTSALMVVPFDTRLPVYAWTTARADVHVAGHGTAYVRRGHVQIWPSPRPTAAQVIATGRRFLGRRYLWAGTTSFGFDCSGFTHSILRHHGITVPRDSGPQLNSSGLPRVAKSSLRAGDLVFWATAPGGSRIRHVGLYVGGGQVLHAPNIGYGVMVSPLDAVGVADYAGAVRPAYA